MTDSPSHLDEAGADPDPVAQFASWLAAASGAGLSQPEAAAVATATPDGRPSARMVLVKRADADGFVFYTNYESRKGVELAANPRAVLLFFWEPLGRQVRIEGPVARTSRADSLAYAHSRARDSQLSALASPQSRPVPSRAALEQRVAELADQHAGAEVPLAEHWGGFRLTPEVFEFWQQGASRLHDRLRYTRDGDGWRIERLAP